METVADRSAFPNTESGKGPAAGVEPPLEICHNKKKQAGQEAPAETDIAHETDLYRHSGPCVSNTLYSTVQNNVKRCIYEGLNNEK